MLKARDVKRRYQRSGVLDIKCRLCIDAILGEVFVDRGTEELSVDQDVEGYAVFFAL